MGWNDPDVYYNPEHFGLEIVTELDLGAAYEFDLHVVWKHANGYYVGSDSGCSCPSPFEDYTSLDDLRGPMTRSEVLKWLDELTAWDEKMLASERLKAIERLRNQPE